MGTRHNDLEHMIAPTKTGLPIITHLQMDSLYFTCIHCTPVEKTRVQAKASQPLSHGKRITAHMVNKEFPSYYHLMHAVWFSKPNL